MLPIPGTSKVSHLEQNVAAAEIKLSDEEFETLSKAGAQSPAESGAAGLHRTHRGRRAAVPGCASSSAPGHESPFGAFTDVMLQTADDERVLLAPDDTIADFVSSTYRLRPGGTGRGAPRLSASNSSRPAPKASTPGSVSVGPRRSTVCCGWFRGGWRLHRAWLRAVDPVAARVVPGVHTYGTAGNGRVEYYGVRRSRRITAIDGALPRCVVSAAWHALRPPVEFRRSHRRRPRRRSCR